MNRRAVWAILKVIICALVLPGCASLKFFQKDTGEAPEAVKADTPLVNSASLLPPEQPARRAFDNPEAPGPFDSHLKDRSATESAIKPVVAILPATVTPPANDDPLVKALEAVLKNSPNEALKYLEAFDPPTQDLLLRLLPMLATLKEKGLDKLSRDEVGNLYEQLEALLMALRPRTDLVIDKMCFCKEVKGFGKYDPVDDGHVNRPGELVWLYVELRNFCAEHHGPFYEIRLSSRAKIHDPKKPDDAPLWECILDDPKEPMRIRRRMHSYFQNYRFVVPPNMQPGVYRLTLTLPDESQPEHRRVAERSMAVRVATAAR